MVREIKFRAWEKKEKRIIYWEGIIDFAKTIITIDNSNLANLEDLVLMQYTGLLDRRGKEIYEGDIVKTPFGIGEIFMRLGCWFVENQKELGYFKSGEIEVVGNIYESSKLLEKGEGGGGNGLERKRSSKFGVV